MKTIPLTFNMQSWSPCHELYLKCLSADYGIADIEELLALGVDINCDFPYWTPVIACATADWYEKDMGKTAFLLNHGARLDTAVNMFEVQGATALMAAAAGGLADKIEQFLKFGAEVNAISCDGKSALMLAAISEDDSPQKVELLLSHGAISNLRDAGGLTALELAIKQLTLWECELSNLDVDSLSWPDYQSKNISNLKAVCHLLEK